MIVPMKLDLLFRSCSRSDIQRYIPVSKGELLVGCLNSVIGSIAILRSKRPDIEIVLHVLDDHSDPHIVGTIQAALHTLQIKTVFVPMTDTGQSASMHFANIYARDNCKELIYFIEDDYLHAPSALLEMVEAYEDFSANTGRHAIISPSDHVVEYRPPNVNTRPLSRVVVGRARHWRTAPGTTSTYLIHRWTLDTYWDLYSKHATFAPDNDICEDNTINLIYRKEYCFSPLPSLAAHIEHPDLKSPFFDYESLWDMYKQ